MGKETWLSAGIQKIQVVGLMLGQRWRRWPSIKTTLCVTLGQISLSMCFSNDWIFLKMFRAVGTAGVSLLLCLLLGGLFRSLTVFLSEPLFCEFVTGFSCTSNGSAVWKIFSHRSQCFSDTSLYASLLTP